MGCPVLPTLPEAHSQLSRDTFPGRVGFRKPLGPGSSSSVNPERPRGTREVTLALVTLQKPGSNPTQLEGQSRSLHAALPVTVHLQTWLPSPAGGPRAPGEGPARPITMGRHSPALPLHLPTLAGPLCIPPGPPCITPGPRDAPAA